MKEFPSNLRVENRDNFPQISYSRVKAYLRRDLYEHILMCEESDYFMIDSFNEKWLKDMTKTKKMVTEIREELHELGWHTETSYGETGLFIYANEKPRNCLPDGL